jgi:hypothetical protein
MNEAPGNRRFCRAESMRFTSAIVNIGTAQARR